MADVHLVLVRHATAEDHAVSGRDADRRLSPLGVLQSQHLAQAALALGLPQPSCVLSSGYVRADETRQCFSWMQQATCSEPCLSPWGKPSEAADILRGYRALGHSVIWVFSHNPFLSVFLRDFAPTVFSAVGKVRKADLFWLRWRNATDFLTSEPDLKGFLSKPRVDSKGQG
jgi:phosphohistidine phosphatase SixA